MSVLRAGGAAFDPDAFLATSPWTEASVSRVGEPSIFQSRGINTSSGMTVPFTERDWSDWNGMIQDAENFLRDSAFELRRLRSFPGIEDVYVDFPVELRIGRNNVAVQSDCFPPTLIAALGALSIGLEFTIYPCSEEDEET